MQQHIVPVLCLKHFTDRRGHVWTFDKRLKTYRSSRPEESGTEGHYYSVEREDGSWERLVDIRPRLSKRLAADLQNCDSSYPIGNPPRARTNPLYDALWPSNRCSRSAPTDRLGLCAAFSEMPGRQTHLVRAENRQMRPAESPAGVGFRSAPSSVWLTMKNTPAKEIWMSSDQGKRGRSFQRNLVRAFLVCLGPPRYAGPLNVLRRSGSTGPRSRGTIFAPHTVVPTRAAPLE